VVYSNLVTCMQNNSSWPQPSACDLNEIEFAWPGTCDLHSCTAGGSSEGGAGGGSANGLPVCPVGDVTQDASITLVCPELYACAISGSATNVDVSGIRVVAYARTNQWWVQPWYTYSLTNICDDGSWSLPTNGWSSGNPWSAIEVLLVDQTQYTIQTTQDPNVDPKQAAGVLASFTCTY
jgi:hypothetical protein